MKGLLTVLSFVAVLMFSSIPVALAETGNKELIAGETKVLDAVGAVAALPVTLPMNFVHKESAQGVAHEVGRTAWAQVRVTGKLVGAVVNPTNGDNWTELFCDVGRTAVSPLTVTYHVARGLLSAVGVVQ